MELSDILHQMMQQSLRAAQLTDLKIGTVTSAKPLEISINPAMGPLKQSVLYLTAAVVEKKIPVLEHTHSSADGATGPALSGLACYENGAALPVQGGYLLHNRALATGDKVLLLRVQSGQKYIVLSRLF